MNIIAALLTAVVALPPAFAQSRALHPQEPENRWALSVLPRSRAPVEGERRVFFEESAVSKSFGARRPAARRTSKIAARPIVPASAPLEEPFVPSRQIIPCQEPLPAERCAMIEIVLRP